MHYRPQIRCVSRTLEKALDLLSRDKTEIEEATGTLGSRLFCKFVLI